MNILIATKKIIKAFVPYGILTLKNNYLNGNIDNYFNKNTKRLVKNNIQYNHLIYTVITPIGENIVKITRNDIKAPLFLRNDTSDVHVYRAIFDENEYDFLVEKEPQIIIDAGANIGLSTILFANRYPNATIIAIEPETSNIKMLEKNTEPYDNIHIIKAALWDSVDEINLFDVGLDNWSFMVGDNHNDIRLPDTKERQLTKTITIDKIMEEYNIDKIDILKMDIEGSEREVFNKSSGWIENVNSIIVELHERMKKGVNKSFFQVAEKFGDRCKNGEDIYLTKENYIKMI
jgi:FkbM family methyltransferase